MNSDYATIVKKIRDEQDINLVMSSQQINNFEKRLGYGKPFVPVIYMLLVGNAMIYAQRNGFLQSKNYFLATVLLSYPIASFLGSKLFGVTKLRDLAKTDQDTLRSYAYYNSLTEKKQ